jgi:hypothetical protein
MAARLHTNPLTTSNSVQITTFHSGNPLTGRNGKKEK